MKKLTGLLAFALMMTLLLVLCDQTAKAEPNPEVTIPNYTLGENYQAGEPIYITFPDGIPENYFVYATVNNEAGEQVYYTSYSSGSVSEGRVTLFWHGLDQGIYTVIISSSYSENGYAYNSSEMTHVLTVSGVRPGAPSVEILNDTAVMSEKEGWVQGCEILVNSPNITDFFLTGYDSPEKENDVSTLEYRNGGSSLVNDSQMSISVTAHRPGTFWYEITTLSDGRWSAASDLFTLTFEAAVPWPEIPVLTVPTSLRAGEPVNIGIISGFPEDGYIRVETKDMSNGNIINNEWLYSGAVDENGTYDLHLYGLDAGTYDITAYYDVSRYENSESVTYPLTVSGTRPETPQVTVKSNDALVNGTNEIAVSGAAFTAYEIRQYDDQSNWRTQSGEDGGWQRTDEGTMLQVSLYYSMVEDYAGKDVRHSIRVKINGCWTNWSEDFKLRWQPLPIAPAQNITWKDEYLAGEPITVTLERVLDIETYETINAGIYKDNIRIADGYISCYGTSEGNLTFVIEETGLDAGQYDIAFLFRKNDCEENEVKYTDAFIVTGERPAAPTISVTNNNALKSESIIVTAAAEGLTEVHFEYKTVENGNYYNSRYASGDGSAIWTMRNYGSDLNRWVRAMAKINGRWSVFSSDVQVAWRTLGKATVPEMEFPETLLAGQSLTATIPDGLAYDEELKISFFKEEMEYADSWHYCYGPVTAGEEIVVEDVGLDSGNYTLKVTAYKTNYENSDEKTVGSLTVTGERPAVPAVTLSSTSYDGTEPIIVTVTGEGLERVTQSGTEYLATGGMVTFSFTPAYNQRLYLRAKIGEQWTAGFETEEIINNAEGVHLEAPEAAIDGLTHEMGTDLAFTLQTDPKADLYTASIILYSDDYDYAETIAYELVLEVDEEGHTRIPAEYFQSPGIYRITLMNYGNGFYGSEAGPYEVTIPAGEESVSLPVITVEAAEAGKGLTVVIRHQTAEKLALDGHVIGEDDDHGYTFYYETDITPENGEARITFTPDDLEGSGLYFFYAAACDNGKWSTWTESADMEYTETLISLPEAQIIEYPKEACFDEPLTFIWEELEEADYYIASIDGNGVIRQEMRVEAGTTTATFIPRQDTTQNYHSLDIYVAVEAFAENRLSSYESQHIVFLLPWKPVITAEKNTASPGEVLQFTVQGEGNQMKARITGRNEGYLSFVNENGQSTIALDFPAAGTYTVQVAMSTLRSTLDYPAWSQWSDPVTITVSEDAEIPDSVTLTLPGDTIRIESEAFAGAAARRVVINSGCTFIGDRAFANCRNLKQVVIPASVTSISESAFDGCGTLTIITPSGSIAETYAAGKGWLVTNN